MKLMQEGPTSDGAMWATGIVRNLATDRASQEALHAQPGMVDLLIRMLSAGVDSKFTVQAAAALSNLCIENHLSKERIREAGAIPILCSLLADGAKDIAALGLDKVISALSTLAANNPSNKEAIRLSGGTQTFVQLYLLRGRTSAGPVPLEKLDALTRAIVIVSAIALRNIAAMSEKNKKIFESAEIRWIELEHAAKGDSGGGDPFKRGRDAAVGTAGGGGDGSGGGGVDGGGGAAAGAGAGAAGAGVGGEEAMNKVDRRIRLRRQLSTKLVEAAISRADEGLSVELPKKLEKLNKRMSVIRDDVTKSEHKVRDQ